MNISKSLSKQIKSLDKAKYHVEINDDNIVITLNDHSTLYFGVYDISSDESGDAIFYLSEYSLKEANLHDFDPTDYSPIIRIEMDNLYDSDGEVTQNNVRLYYGFVTTKSQNKYIDHLNFEDRIPLNSGQPLSVRDYEDSHLWLASTKISEYRNSYIVEDFKTITNFLYNAIKEIKLDIPVSEIKFEGPFSFDNASKNFENYNEIIKYFFPGVDYAYDIRNDSKISGLHMLSLALYFSILYFKFDAQIFIEHSQINVLYRDFIELFPEFFLNTKLRNNGDYN